jgi:hypothetical protein
MLSRYCLATPDWWGTLLLAQHRVPALASADPPLAPRGAAQLRTSSPHFDAESLFTNDVTTGTGPPTVDERTRQPGLQDRLTIDR